MRTAGLVLAACLALPASAQEAVFLVRHAEKGPGDDPTLTAAGRERARGWARMLEDAGIDAVITSTARRTAETGGIVANALGLMAESLPPTDTAGLLDLMSFDYEDGRVLVVGHNETIPRILAALGHDGEITMVDDEFDRLFVVTGVGAGVKVVQLRMP